MPVIRDEADEKVLKFKRRVTLRQVEILASLSKTGSMAQTAIDLHMSVAGVCRACQRFESHFGFAIFEKHGRSFVVSEPGRKVLRDISKLDRSIRALGKDFTKHFTVWADT